MRGWFIVGVACAIAFVLARMYWEHRLPGRKDELELPAPWGQLPTALAEQLHYTTAQVPALPVADSLCDIRHWPATMTIDGVAYQRRTSRAYADLVPADSNVIDPGGYYEAFYFHPDNPRKLRGPAYFWLVDSTLIERTYRGSLAATTLQYDARGRLRAFTASGDQPFLEESFGDSGELVGFRLESERYWKGVRRTDTEYSNLRLQWIKALPTGVRQLR